MAHYQDLRREQVELRKRGVLMGIGLAAFLDKSGTRPSRQLSTRGGLHGGFESATIRVHTDGKVTVFSGSHSHGQGTHHVRANRRRPARCPDRAYRAGPGRHRSVPYGNGTWGSRSASVGGTAIYRASETIIAKARLSRRICWNARATISTTRTPFSRSRERTARFPSPKCRRRVSRRQLSFRPGLRARPGMHDLLRSARSQ